MGGEEKGNSGKRFVYIEKNIIIYHGHTYRVSIAR